MTSKEEIWLVECNSGCRISQENRPQTREDAIDGLGHVIGLLVQRNLKRQRERVAECGADQFPGSDARIEILAEDPRLLAADDDRGQVVFIVRVERTQEVGDFGIVGFDERAVHDAKFESVFAGAAEIEIDDDPQFFERVGDRAGAFGETQDGRLSDLLENFEKKGLLTFEVPIEHRLRNAGGLGDLFGRRVLEAEFDEEAFGVRQQLFLAIRLGKPRRGRTRWRHARESIRD